VKSSNGLEANAIFHCSIELAIKEFRHVLAKLSVSSFTLPGIRSRASPHAEAASAGPGDSV